MPVRLLRDGILDSEAVCSLDYATEVFYRRLMSAVDDFGRFDGRPSVLRSRLYPLQIDKVREADISRWIAACEKAGLIALYSVSNKPYLLFHKLGDPRSKTSKFPAPQESESICKHMKADESIGKHVLSDVPYSDSITDSITDSIKNPPTPPQPGGTADGEKPAKEKPRRSEPRKPEAIPVPAELSSPEFCSVWATWLAARKPTERAAGMQLKSLIPLGPKAATECIESSLRNDWQGIFPEKHKTTSSPARPAPTIYKSAAERAREHLADQIQNAINPPPYIGE